MRWALHACIDARSCLQGATHAHRRLQGFLGHFLPLLQQRPVRPQTLVSDRPRGFLQYYFDPAGKRYRSRAEVRPFSIMTADPVFDPCAAPTCAPCCKAALAHLAATAGGAGATGCCDIAAWFVRAVPESHPEART